MKTATGVAAFLLHAELKVRLLKRGKSQVQRFQINCQIFHGQLQYEEMCNKVHMLYSNIKLTLAKGSK